MSSLQNWRPTREALDNVCASVRRDYPQKDETTREQIRAEGLRWLQFWQREWAVLEREARVRERESGRPSR